MQHWSLKNTEWLLYVYYHKFCYHVFSGWW